MPQWATLLRGMATRWAVRLAATALPPAPPSVLSRAAMGLRFANPLGLAAGFDRDGALLGALGACGFGFVEIGTLRAAARRPDRVDRAVAHLMRFRRASDAPLVGISIGSGDGGFGPAAIAGFRGAMRRLWPYADYVVANLSGVRAPDSLITSGLLDALAAARDDLARQNHRRVPLAIKLPLEPTGRRAWARMKAAGIDAVIGVSADIALVIEAARALGGIPLISVGGIRSGADVSARLAAGATLVQVHGAFARGGPFYPRRLLAELQHIAAREPEPVG